LATFHKYEWSYYYWSLYCNLAIVMIRKYLKSDKSWSIVFAMAPNFSYLCTIKKIIVISMLNYYCRKEFNTTAFVNLHIYDVYVHIILWRNLNIVSTKLFPQSDLFFFTCFAASGNELYIFRQYTYIVSIVVYQKPQSKCQIV
jgi:hypothetical protein